MTDSETMSWGSLIMCANVGTVVVQLENGSYSLKQSQEVLYGNLFST